MDTFQALLKLILDEKSLNKIQSQLNNKSFNIKVKADLDNVKSEVDKMASEFSRLSKVNTMQSWVDNNSKAMNKFGTELSQIISKMGNLDVQITQDESAKLTSRFKEIQAQARDMGETGKSAAEKFKIAWEKLGGWDGWDLGKSLLGKIQNEFSTKLFDGLKNIGRPEMFGLN